MISKGKGFRTDLVPNGTKKDIISANSPKGTDTREEIAELSKVGSSTVSRVEFIRDNADEETKTKLRSGNAELSINKVYTNLKKEDIYKGRHGGDRTKQGANVGTLKGKTRDIIAKQSNVGHNTVAKVKFIRDNADGSRPAGRFISLLNMLYQFPVML